MKPILDNFDEERWAKQAWTKLVLIIVVCNGGNSNVMQVDEQEGTVQDRLIRLITDSSAGSHHAEKLIDTLFLDKLIDSIGTQLCEDMYAMLAERREMFGELSNATSIASPDPLQARRRRGSGEQEIIR